MQSRVIALASALIALTFVPRAAARAQSGLSIGANAGIAFPTSDLGNIVNTGYTVGITVGSRSAVGNPLGFRAEGTFSEFGFQGGGDVKHRIVGGIGNLTYDLMPSGTSALYGIGGVGIYGSYDSSNSLGNTSTQTVFGFNVGGGYRFALSGFSCYLEARYHHLSGSSMNGINDSYVPLTFGVQF